MSLNELLSRPQFSLERREKEEILLAELCKLTERHRLGSHYYAKLLEASGHKPNQGYTSIENIPFLPVSLFKTFDIKSIPDEDVLTVMTSSGTTGQSVSRISLDHETAKLQTRALSSVLTSAIGKQRLPMLIVDSRKTIRDPRLLSARGAGVLGLMQFGRDHTFLLDDEMKPDVAILEAFLSLFGQKPFLIFGFTFMAWQYLYEIVKDGKHNLSNGTLIHSGGWKKLIDLAVDNYTFRERFKTASGLQSIYNFYGMVEQMGSIFLEGPDGYLYPPNFVDVIVRDPYTLSPLPFGHPGLVQVLSLVPHSYPGHSLLTEDIGIIHYEDNPDVGCNGKALSIVGRAPKSELRGCSDTHAFDKAKAA